MNGNRTVSTEAVLLWGRVRERAAARYPQTHCAYVEDLAPYELAADTLTCVSATEFTLRKLESAGMSSIEEELTGALSGVVRRLRIEVFDPERHQHGVTRA